ncbi:MAG: SRPBCC domain-containing protein [Hyphomonadaceae bacterium]|nr:SRPBCC domain-containing protein [Hyphomonadaceae bacterium]
MAATDLDARSMIITRVIDAPRALVFEAWTDPRHLAEWWGPDGFTTTTHSFDMRKGGVWRFTMHGPDGRDYENRITFDEIVRPERISYRHDGAEDSDAVEDVQFHTVVTFEEGQGRTRVTLRAVFATAEMRDRVMREVGAEEGGHQTVGRLAAYVEKQARGEDAHTLIITRVFDAPRELVWRMWTEQEHALKWAGPRDHPLVKSDHDVRPGGKWRSCLQSVADGRDLWQGGTYREVIAPERLVFTMKWDGEDDDMLITVDFEEVGDFADEGAKTRMSFRQDFLPSAASRDGHAGGWASTFDRLAEHLAAQR